MIVGQDAIGSYWINGTPVSIGNPGNTSPVTFSVPVSLLNPLGSNEIAVSIYNSNTGYVWASWDLKIVCAEGTTFDQASVSGGVQMYNYQLPGAHPTPYPSNVVSSLPPVACAVTWFTPGYCPGA